MNGKRRAASGRRWTWDGVNFELWQWAHARESNPKSCVLQIEASGERMLLTGDIDMAAERALLESVGIPTDWLQSPHHGSRSSSSMALLDRLRPKAVLISRGQGNSFGHPHPTVLARYQKYGMAIYDSADQVPFISSSGRFEAPRSMRLERRFWRDPPPLAKITGCHDARPNATSRSSVRRPPMLEWRTFSRGHHCVGIG
jgi:competence protein ComEC